MAARLLLKRGRSGLENPNASRRSLMDPASSPSAYGRCRPDLIHSMEFQHSGYLVLRARELYGPGFPTWLATNWGSDIFYFGRFADHRAQISTTPSCD